MQLLPSRPPVPGAQPIQPGLPVLRGAHHPTPGHDADTAVRLHTLPPQRACRMGGPWPQRGRDTGAGLWPSGLDTRVWPGRTIGIRPPAEGETPLSHAEVAHAVRHNAELCGGTSATNAVLNGKT